MADKECDALVIGAGPGGYVCAIRLGQLKQRTILVEKAWIGGTCLQVGCIPSKALISAAKFYEKLQHASEFGVQVQGASIDFKKMVAWERSIVEKFTGGVRQLLKANNVEVLFYGGYHTEGGLIVRQMREQGLKARMVAGDALFIPEFWSITGNAGEGTLASFSPDPRNNKEAAAVVKKFRDQGYEPEGYTLYSYAAVQAWAQAAATAKSTDAKKVAAALKSGTFSTVLGKISFDKKGDIKGETYMMYEWTKGALKPIKKISS